MSSYRVADVVTIHLTENGRMIELVLASGSPRRSDILSGLGLRFSVVVPRIDETPKAGEAPRDYVTRLAVEKAAAVVPPDSGTPSPNPSGITRPRIVQSTTDPSHTDPSGTGASGTGRLWIAADTTVVLDDAIVGKPTDADDAAAILHAMQGRTHRVLTGIALSYCDEATCALVSSADESMVSIRAMSDEEIAWYVSTGEPLDKAGAYGLQGIGSIFVTRVVGHPSNVIGLPIPLLFELMARLGIRWS